MAEIFAIRTATVESAVGAAEPAIVSMFEELLEAALRGEIVAAAVTVVRPNGRIGTDWKNPSANGHLLVAAIHYLAHEIMVASEARPESEPPTGAA